MQHDLSRIVGRVSLVALGPVVADGVRKYGAVAVELGCRNAATHIRVALEPMLRVLVPEVEGTVATGRAKRAVLRVEGDGVDRVHVGHVILRGVAVAFEGEVHAGYLSAMCYKKERKGDARGTHL